MKKLFMKSAQSGTDDPGVKRSWRSLRLVIPYFRRYALRLIAGFATLILVDSMQLWIPRIIKGAVDDLQMGAATRLSLLGSAGQIILLAVLIALLRYFWRGMLLGFSRLIETHFRMGMFSHILTLDRSFYQRKPAGEIMALATNDLSSVQLAFGMGLVAMVDAVYMGVAAFAFMAYIDPWLTIIAISPMPLLTWLTGRLSGRLHKRFKNVQEHFSALTEFVRSTLANIRLVKAYNQEERQASRFNAMGEEYVQNNIKLALVNGILFPISGFIGNVGMLMVLFFGGRKVIRGDITAGDFVAFINYLLLMTWPMMAMGWVADLFQRGMTSLGRIEALFNERSTIEEPDGTGLTMHPTAVSAEAAPSAIAGDIRIESLTFAYSGQSAPALEDIKLDIPAGRLVGIVGRTGSGKTTLCHLLARFYPVTNGTIFFDRRDVNGLDLATVRGAIAYVPQDVVLFSDTIAFNITLGKPSAPQEEIEAAARAAAIHEEILSMKDGYETRIGERGVKLSGGQRQRLAIARALLLDRPILIIDDALSAVDMETEHTIIGSIAAYLKGRTCIVVSHRVAPLADVHEIVVLEQGRIVARGTHDELLEKSPFYATIYRQQTRQD